MTGPRCLDRTDVKILASLAVIPLILFTEAVTGQRVFYERDILAYWFSQAETIVRVMAQGSWPLWDPYEGFGRPLLAGPQAQLLYPFTWFDLLLPPAYAYAALVVVHTWLAAAGAYVLLRSWELSRASAVAAAIMLSCSGPFVSAASLFHHLVGAAWLPWVLAAFESFLRRRTSGSAVALGIVAALQILAGSGDMVVIAALSASLLLAARLLRDGRSALSRPAPARLGLAAVVALALSAAQWLPALAVASGSNRSAMSRETNLYWSVHPVSLVELIVPQALPSLPLSDGLRAALFESREPFLPCLYLGLSAALLFLPFARSTDRRLGAIALAGFVFFLLAALGRHTPLLPVLLNLPVISIFRYPVKYMLGAAVFWAAAAALGAEAWLRPWSKDHRHRARWTAAVAVAVAVAAIAGAETLRIEAPRLDRWVSAPPDWRPLAYAPLVWKLRRASAVAALCALVLLLRQRAPMSRTAVVGAALLVTVDMVTAARGINELAAPELATYRPPVLSLLPGPADQRRLFAPTLPLPALNRSLVRGPAGWPQAWSWALGIQQMLHPPSGARWGLRGSYDADFTGMGAPAASQLAAFVEHYRRTPLGLRLLQMASVTDVVTVLRDPVPGLVPIGELATVFKDPVRVARVPGTRPRAYLVNHAFVARGEEAWRTLAAPDFDPAEAILLAEDGGVPPVSDFRGTARVLEAKPDRWTVSTEAAAAGYLVITEANAPGWRADVDGRPAAVVTANLVFRAVAVPAGTHTVVLRYRPRAVIWGFALSGAAVIAIGGFMASERMKSRAAQ